ncbi:MAG: sulfite exporter TauE/SafE family protein [Mycobacteriales bacterium]
MALAGLVVGFVVGLTGMGGGALMTPILVLIFGIQPLAAVSSDLVVSLAMKPVGGAVHLRRGTVDVRMVKWLVVGSVPTAFAGAVLVTSLGSGASLQRLVQTALGATLVIASVAILLKSLLIIRRGGRGRTALGERPERIRPVQTCAIGAVGGLIVGMTSVGSGSLIIVLLMLLYPSLSAKSLVGTDLVQAVPLVGSAALGHLLFGDVQFGLTTSLLVGGLPGVYAGARLSSRASGTVIRRCLVFVLFASGMKLLGLPAAALGGLLLALALTSVPIWGLARKVAKAGAPRQAAGLSRTEKAQQR